VAGYPLTRAPRACAACGAKNHPDWRKCQRCQSPLLVAAVVERPEQSDSTLRIGFVAPMAAIAAILAIGGVLLLRGSDQPSVQATESGGARTGSRRSGAAEGDVATGADRRALGDPVTPADFTRRGVASFRGDDFASALTQFEAAVVARPDDPNALDMLGQTLVRLNRAPEAIPRLESAVRLAPSKWSYRFNLARARGLSGDWVGAVEDYRAADRLFPDDHATLFNLALALRQAGRTAEAAPMLERVIALAPEDPSFVLTAARTYDELDRREEAVASYRKFLSQSATGADADAARGRLARLESSDGPKP
jgi:tetratricopeptide (TPR) repeat protein